MALRCCSWTRLVLFLVLACLAWTEAGDSPALQGEGGSSGWGIYQAVGKAYSYTQSIVDLAYSETETAEGLECYFVKNTCDFAVLDYRLDAATTEQLTAGTWRRTPDSPDALSYGGKTNKVFTPDSAVMQLPVAVSPYVFGYRLDGLVAPLVLSGPLVARMWMGEVTLWNDPLLVALNPQLASLPSSNLSIALHYVASEYGSTPLLAATLSTLHPPFANLSREAWFDTSPASVAFGSLKQAVATVSSTNGALVFATLAKVTASNGLKAARMVNPAGFVVSASADSVDAAMTDFASAISATPSTDIHLLSLVGAPSKASWPMCAFTLVAVSANVTALDCVFAQQLFAAVGWMQLNIEINEDILAQGSMTLPPRLTKEVIDVMGTATCSGNRAFTKAMIMGTGSPMTAYSRWAEKYGSNSNVTVNYVATKGKQGKLQIKSGDVDFGATNSDLTDEDHANYPDLSLIPVAAHPVVFCYNVEELNGAKASLVLDVRTSLAVLMGEVDRWDHPSIVALNPSLTMPSRPIIFVGKTGSSIYTSTLSAAYSLIDPAFAAEYGSSDDVPWPVMTSGRYLQSNLSDYVQTLKATPYSFSYTAHYIAIKDRNIREFSMLNAEGTGVLSASRAATLAAVDEVVSTTPGGLAGLQRLTHVVGATGPSAWPFNNLCLVVIHSRTMPDPYKAREMLRYMHWIQTSREAEIIADATGVFQLASLPTVWPQILTTLVEVTVQGVRVNTLYPCFSNGSLCSDRGTCDEAAGQCVCDKGRTGTYCEKDVVKAEARLDSTDVVYIAVLVPLFVVGVCVICAALLVAFAISRRRQNQPYEWVVDYEDIEIETELAEGGYGVVSKGKWKDSEVAIKTIKADRVTGEMEAAFREEVKVMTSLRHPNVVLFMGACTKAPNLCIIMEYMALGSLYDLLHNELVPDVPLSLATKIAWQAAKGMSFLHQRGVVHRDLKSLNLLLDSKWNVKISDFGLTKFKSDLANRSIQRGGRGRVEGSVHWMAPEVLACDGSPIDFTLADSYSFGVIMWEMITRLQPYQGMTPAAIAVGVIRGTLALDVPSASWPEFAKITACCLRRDPTTRPTFPEIIAMLCQVPLDSPLDPSASLHSASASSEHPVDSYGFTPSAYAPNTLTIGSVTYASTVLASSSVVYGNETGTSVVTTTTTAAVGAHQDTTATSTIRDCIVLVDIANARAVWAAVQGDPGMADAVRQDIDLYYETLRKTSASAHGREVRCALGSGFIASGIFSVLFADVKHALPWCEQAHKALSGISWRTGLKARMAINTGAMGAWSLEEQVCRTTCHGEHVDTCHRLLRRTPGRGVYATAAVHEAWLDVSEGLGQASLLFSKVRDDDDDDDKEDAYRVRFGRSSLDKRQRGKDKQTLPSDEERSTDEIDVSDAPLAKWIIERSSLTVSEKIGEGSFGVVCRGRWKRTEVAIKTLINRHTNRLAFMAETSVHAGLDHPNVLAFVGVCLQDPCIVTEYIPGGDLRALLDQQHNSLTKTDKLTILHTAALGVAYLHSRTPAIIHRDLKSSNLLVGDSLSMKVADFGFARIKETNATMTRCGTPCWTAPEIITGERYTEKADVYSFGIIMWEVITGKRPYADLDIGRCGMAVVAGERPPLPQKCRRALVDIMTRCWHADPDQRPSMEEVTDDLRMMLVARRARHGRGDIEMNSM
ncbi:serine/threonine protein kinase [Mollivirus kamchatka]|nr:serine/threonine protein kinase [Mollivirus kamchatka]